MGRPFGIPVYVSPTWFVVALLITYVFAPSISARLPGIGGWAYAVSFAFAVLLYLSVLLHELSHSVVAQHFGLPVRRITLHLLGGVSEIAGEPATPWRDFLVAFAGPATSLVVGGAGWGVVRLLPEDTVAAVLLAALTVANLLVGVFNLLPGLPLDGGRVLQALVWRVSGSRTTGVVVAAWAGRVLAAVVLVAPAGWAAVQGRTPDVVDVVWGALLASFIWVGATQSLLAARVRERLPRLTARTLTRRALPVSAQLSVSEAVRQAIETGAQAMVVVDAEGHPVGLVNDAAIVATPDHRRPWVEIGTLSRRIEPGLVLQVDLAGEELVQAMGAHPAGEYLVVDENGLVFGVLVTHDVEKAFAARD
jgi:Zn-dependent protease